MKRFKADCIDRQDEISCHAATQFCEVELTGAIATVGNRNLACQPFPLSSTTRVPPGRSYYDLTRVRIVLQTPHMYLHQNH